MKTVPLIGRLLYAMPFVIFGMGHLTNPGMKDYAGSMGVPGFLVPVTGLLIMAGGGVLIGWFGAGPLALDKD